MKKNILDRIRAGEILLADGALGTMLMERGLKAGECPELMNLERPGPISEVSGLYLEAGSDLISTNTFGASPLKLADYFLAEKVREINVAAVEILRKATEDRCSIMASCGPTGKLLKPYGEMEPDRVFDSYKSQISVLIEAGVDAIIFETFTDLNEVTLAIKAAREVSPAIPLIATMTFDKIPKGFFTIMGVNIEKAASGLKKAGADIIGSNCGNGIENMIQIAREFKRVSDLPIVIQSNAGLPEVRGERLFYKETPDFMAEKSKELVSAGISILGGCCGTTPQHIAAFRNILGPIKKHSV